MTSQRVGPQGSMPLIQRHSDDDNQRYAHTKAFVTSEWKRLHDQEAGCGSHTMTGDVQSRMHTTDSLSKMKSGKSSQLSSPPDVMASTSSNREMIDIPAKHCGGQIKDVLQGRYHENTNLKRNIPHGYRPITSQKAQTSTTEDELARLFIPVEPLLQHHNVGVYQHPGIQKPLPQTRMAAKCASPQNRTRQPCTSNLDQDRYNHTEAYRSIPHTSVPSEYATPHYKTRHVYSSKHSQHSGYEYISSKSKQMQASVATGSGLSHTGTEGREPPRTFDDPSVYERSQYERSPRPKRDPDALWVPRMGKAHEMAPRFIRQMNLQEEEINNPDLWRKVKSAYKYINLDMDMVD